jgi:hypothetical protein
VHDLGRSKHGLGGHTPFIDSRTSDIRALDESDFRSQVGRHVSGGQAALARSNHPNVIVERAHLASSSTICLGLGSACFRNIMSQRVRH